MKHPLLRSRKIVCDFLLTVNELELMGLTGLNLNVITPANMEPGKPLPVVAVSKLLICDFVLHELMYDNSIFSLVGICECSSD